MTLKKLMAKKLKSTQNSNLDNKKKLTEKEQGVLPGFKVASNSDYQLERFDPPVIPMDFVPLHEFPTPLDINNKFADTPPPEIPPP
ncbi:G patch domain-containing protein TGH [Camellia lanceoleosa]|uniref:G patch domain-containing protein TGH n=1 Tax=Camellia lanceoleosa TaxID=1840588 RepID=A0ACC0I1S4_9ERIC|nr:G patch domain-containing protein TGH [Camellia lanceoleosa]